MKERDPAPSNIWLERATRPMSSTPDSSLERTDQVQRQWPWRYRRIFATLAIAVIGVMAAAPAGADHLILTHRDGYDFIFPDNLNARGNRTAFSNEVARRGFTTGHLGYNRGSFTAFNNLAYIPQLYYTSGHDYYVQGGPHVVGGFAAEQFWDGTSHSALANNAAQNAVMNAIVESYDITSAPLNNMVLAVIQRCASIWRDSTGTSPAHAFNRNGTGARTAIGFFDLIYFDVSATNTSAGPDGVWANEFWRQVGNGQRVGTAAQLANDKVVQVFGQHYGYSLWGIVGTNAAI